MNMGEINEDDNREWVPATTEIIIRYHTFKSVFCKPFLQKNANKNVGCCKMIL